MSIDRQTSHFGFDIDMVADCVRSLDWEVVETIPSPITGMEGNKEFLLLARRSNPTPKQSLLRLLT